MSFIIDNLLFDCVYDRENERNRSAFPPLISIYFFHTPWFCLCLCLSLSVFFRFPHTHPNSDASLEFVSVFAVLLRPCLSRVSRLFLRDFQAFSSSLSVLLPTHPPRLSPLSISSERISLLMQFFSIDSIDLKRHNRREIVALSESVSEDYYPSFLHHLF